MERQETNSYNVNNSLGPLDYVDGQDDPLEDQEDLREDQAQRKEKRVRICAVCDGTASGMFFGALVCIPCKAFFIRSTADKTCLTYQCSKGDKQCQIIGKARSSCKYCRYQKCLEKGMCRRERPTSMEIIDGRKPCVVCQDAANGIHFGVISCEGCKKFFRRALTEHKFYICKGSADCQITALTRNSCRFCRYQKCLKGGMSRDAIQMGRPTKTKSTTSEVDKSNMVLQRPSADSSYREYRNTSYDSANNEGEYTNDSVYTCKFEDQDNLKLKIIANKNKESRDSKSTKPDEKHSGHHDPQHHSHGRSDIPQVSITQQPHNVKEPFTSVEFENRDMDLGSVNMSRAVSSINVQKDTSEDALDLRAGVSRLRDLVKSRENKAILGVEVEQPIERHCERQNSNKHQPAVSLTMSIIIEHPSTISQPGRCQTQTNSMDLPGDAYRHPVTHHNQIKGQISNVPLLAGEHQQRYSLVPPLEDPRPVATRKRSGPPPLLPLFQPQVRKMSGGKSNHPNTNEGGLLQTSSVGTSVPSTNNIPTISTNVHQTPIMTIPNDIQHHSSVLRAMLNQPPVTQNISSTADLKRTDSEPSEGTGCSGRVGYFSKCIRLAPLKQQSQASTLPTSLEIGNSISYQSSLMSIPNVKIQASVQSVHDTAEPVSGHTHLMTSSQKSVTSNTGVVTSAQNVITKNTDLIQHMQNVVDTLTSKTSVMSGQTNLTLPVNMVKTSLPDATGAMTNIPMSGSSGRRRDGMETLTEPVSENPSRSLPPRAEVKYFGAEVTKEVARCLEASASMPTAADKTKTCLTNAPLVDTYCNISRDYWLNPILPDENIFMADEHRCLIHTLKQIYEGLLRELDDVNMVINNGWKEMIERNGAESLHIPSENLLKCILLYTKTIGDFITSIPGFQTLDTEDQGILSRLGIATTISLVASTHWYNPDKQNFGEFYKNKPPIGTGERIDMDYYGILVKFAVKILVEEVDQIEVALWLILVVIAADYPHLKDCNAIERIRLKILCCFRAYTRGKYGPENKRIETLFTYVPELRTHISSHENVTQRLHFPGCTI